MKIFNMSNHNNKNIIVAIIGPTASGKTGLAVKLARKFGGEIVSADSRQVYKGMDIGTGKDLDEYTNGGEKIPHHLIDVADPKDYFDLSQYQKMALKSISGIHKRNKIPILAGGTGLYLQAVIDGYIMSKAEPDRKKRQEWENKTPQELFAKLNNTNHKLAQRLNNSDRQNPRRLIRCLEIAGQAEVVDLPGKTQKPPFDALILELAIDQKDLECKIFKRLHERLENENMIGEVEKLNAEGVSWQRMEKFGLEYKWIAYYLQNKLDYNEMTDRLYKDICKYAKRQLSWFRRWKRQGGEIHLIRNHEQAEKALDKFLIAKFKNIPE
jgi:tRNA dimethylallyltransferase